MDKTYFDSTAALSPEGRADAARQAIEPCLKAGDLKAARKWLTHHLHAVSKRLQDRVSQVPSAKSPASGAS